MNVPNKIKVLMIGVDQSTKGGMWTVVENYLNDDYYNSNVDLIYIPTSTVGSIPYRLFFTTISIFKFFFTMIFHKPQILHIHMSEKGSVYRKNIFINMGKIFKCKIIIHMHGAIFQQWFSSLGNKRQNRIKAILNKADKIIILGEYWRNFISQLIPDSKIAIIYNAVKVPENNRYNMNAKKIMFLGVVGQRKGAYDLLDAYDLVKDDLSDFELVYYGPDFDKVISQKIMERNLQDSVHYLGWLDNDEKNNVFNDIICNVLPSYNEGLPMTILETMAYGIPNISTSI